MTEGVDQPLPDRLVEFVGLLREHGVTAGPSDTVDAAAAMVALGLADRARLRAGLAATLLRRNGQREVFDQIFDIYFPASDQVPALPGRKDTSPTAVEALRDQLVAALAAGDQQALDRLAEQALTELGGYGGSPGRGNSPGGSGFSAYLALRELRADELRPRVLAGMGVPAGELDDAVQQIEGDRRLAEFRAMVERKARQRAAQLRGAQRIARHGVEASTDQLSFLSVSEHRLAEMRRLVEPLARKLATRLAARRRKAVRGQIDFRRTLRRSMATGGVPMRPVLRARRHGRPDLVVLADLSGSVAGFAEFTLQLVAALQDQFSKVRSFGFVDTCDEITELFRPGEPPTAGMAARIRREAAVSRWGNSNYGDALGSFVERYLDAVGPRTSVLILGDARSNYADPNLAALRALRDRAKHAYWLNPEPANTWSTGDSVAHRYAREVTMFECRNVRQLTEVVARLLPA
jgi:uncharacterized protein with von Willebrand factor type A (vWA) domain